jgi:hypothetical protein
LTEEARRKLTENLTAFDHLKKEEAEAVKLSPKVVGGIVAQLMDENFIKIG